jgi:predicted nucleic acid-binding protein
MRVVGAAEVVVDASALLAAVAEEPPQERLWRRFAHAELHAPHLIEVEVLHGLRGMALRSELTDVGASEALARVLTLSPRLYPHRGLITRAWALRNSLSAYDAMYVALAEELGMPLLTADRRLARSPGHGARIEVLDR